MKRWIYDKSSFFLILIFVVATALIFFLMGLTYKHLEKLWYNSNQVNHSYEVSLSLESLYAEIKDLETQKRNYIITPDPSVVHEIHSRENKIKNIFTKLQKMVSDNPEQIKNLRSIDEMLKYEYKIIDQALATNYVEHDPDQLKANLLAGKNIMESISGKINDMLSVEKVLMRKRKESLGATQKFTPLFFYLIALFALGLLSFAFYRIFRDLRELRTANQNLQISLNSSRLGEIVGNFGIFIFDFKDRSYTFSDNEFRLLGYEPQEFVADYDDIIRHVHPEDVEFVKRESHKLITDHGTNPFTYRIIRKDGEVRYFETLGKTIINSDGEKILLGITSDITHEIDSKRQLEEHNRILEASNKDLLAFNYVASHDLQEPLRKIETFISRLSDKDGDNLSESGTMYLERMKNAAGRMRVLIEDLLQFSRTTRAEKVFEEADLNELIGHSLEELHHFIEEKHAVVNVQELPVMSVIPFQIQQIFTNLINNSLKYSREGVPPVINITCEKVNSRDDNRIPPNQTGDFYKFTIEDNGIGFDQKFAEKIFIVFNRLHSDNEYEGTGIGLAVCKKIVENHGGYIFAEGIPQDGSKFMVYLPIS